MSPAEESAALRRAVARAPGCAIRDLREVGGRSRGVVECVDGWAAGRLVLALGCEDARAPWAAELAAALRERGRTDWEFADAIRAYLRSRVRFQREPEGRELFQGGRYTLALGEGDCEDHARIVYALARAGGLSARLAFLHRGGDPTHVAAQVLIDGAPVWIETTIAAELGEHPIEAGRRLGILSSRGDITEGMRVMSEDKDLLPRQQVTAPRGLHVRSAPDRAAKSLGLLPYRAGLEVIERGLPPTDGAPRGWARVRIGELEGYASEEWIGDVMAPAAPAPRQSGHLAPSFFRAVEELAARFRARGADVTAFDFLNAWLIESGIGRVMQGHGGLPYYGLNMMAAANLPGVGWTGTPEAYVALGAEGHLPFVERFYEQMVRAMVGGDWSTLRSGTALYLMNFLPAFTKHANDPAFVLAAKGDPKTHAWWRDNPYLRENAGRGDRITVASLTEALARARAENGPYWSEVVARQRAEGGSADPSSSSSGGALVAGLLFVSLLVGGAVLVNR